MTSPEAPSKPAEAPPDSPPADPPQRIEDYALIGDGRTAALVGRNGSVDWLCWPRFDSPACLAALLGDAEHGRFRIAPADPAATVTRRYRDDTLVLETTFDTPTGAVVLIDLMPRGTDGETQTAEAGAEAGPALVRIVHGLRGQVAMRLDLRLRFGYGDLRPWLHVLPERQGLHAIQAVAGPDAVVLHAPVPLHADAHQIGADFTIAAGQRMAFSLTYGPAWHMPPPPPDAEAALHRTEAAWRRWSGHTPRRTDWPEAVHRSLLTLKAMIHADTGGIVAAPTTSLPERLGGQRNWDYRFCWLRDSALVLNALMNAGYDDEAADWRAWLRRAVAGDVSRMQIMYDVAGGRRVEECTLRWLPGYAASTPVRAGNAAMHQLQLDVYGEVMLALQRLRAHGVAGIEDDWSLQAAIAGEVERLWHHPDEGIWEVRGRRRHFTYSKVMCWAAIDRAISDAETHSLPAPLDRWRALRDRIHADVCAHGYHAGRGCFVQSYDRDELDASLLILPLCGFLPVDDPRIAGTIAAIERDLLSDGFVLRYLAHEELDGLPPGEGVFLACSFWLAEVRHMQGRTAEARALFERLLDLRNDVGLLSEEYDSHARRMLGNFPQAFSHCALVSAAERLSKD